MDCNLCRSYQTGKNETVEEQDNDYGDIIVADFNFDKKEDLALKSDSGGNGGPAYKFYLQDSNGKFYLDNFLTDTMTYFPTHINKNNKTLTTLVHANAMELCKSIYKQDKATDKWKRAGRSWVKY